MAQVVRDRRALRRLIQLMRASDDDVRSTAVSVVAKVSLTASRELGSAGVVSACLNLLTNSWSVAEACCILGHVCSSGPVSGSESEQVLTSLSALLQQEGEGDERNTLWLTAAVCNSPIIQTPDSGIQTRLLTLVSRRLGHRDSSVVRDCCRSLSGLLVRGCAASAISAVTETCGRQMIQLLKHEADGVASAALNLIGRVTAAGTCGQVQALLDASLLTGLHTLLSDTSRATHQVRRDVCWITSNCAAGTEAQIQQLGDSGLLSLVCRILAADPDCGSRREAAFCVSHVAQCGSLQQVRVLCESSDAIESLVRCLELRDSRLLLTVLTGLHSLLTCGQWLARRAGPGHLNLYAARVQRAGGEERLQILRHDVDQRVAAKAHDIVHKFFPQPNESCSALWFHLSRDLQTSRKRPLPK